MPSKNKKEIIMKAYNRIIALGMLCGTALGLKALGMDMSDIVRILEVLAMPAGIYVGVKGPGNTIK